MIKPTFEEMRAELDNALAAEDIWHVVDCRTQAESLFSQANAKHLPQDQCLLYQEMVRRGERATAILVRKGQAAGTIRKPQQSKSDLPSPSRFIGGAKASVEFYDLGAVDEETFERAIEACRADKTMTRANVIRKIGPRNPGGNYHAIEREQDWVPEPTDRSTDAKQRRLQIIAEMAADNKTSRQMSERLKIQAQTLRNNAKRHGIDIPADRVVWRSPHHDSSKIITQVALQMEGLTMSAGLVKVDELDHGQIPAWLASLSASVKTISQLIKNLKEETK